MNIIFVCMGNTCRSPLGEGIMKAKLKEAGRPDINVSSMGFMAGGSPASKHSHDIAAEKGVDISNHRSRKLRFDELREADLVFAMEERMVDDILYYVPEIEGRIFALSQFPNKPGASDIADPHGGNKSRYQGTYDQIEAEVERVIPYILQMSKAK